ncbi:Maf family protein [Desulfamplus magnetovallimortis]|nr:Maf family protein [Desulfamplus magnetovallimortis]
MRHKSDLSKKCKIILASKSPRRKYLLEQAGICFEVIPADIEEKRHPNEPPEAYVQRLSKEKADHIAKEYPQKWVIGADTVVVIDNSLLEKPQSTEDARKMLGILSNRTHTVYTGYTICSKSKEDSVTRSVKTDVLFKKLTPREIEWYINTDEPFDKAGAYAIQGLGTFLVKAINGSYTNVVGLPVCEVIEDLMNCGVIERNLSDLMES